jgi:hypothetical protein
MPKCKRSPRIAVCVHKEMLAMTATRFEAVPFQSVRKLTR